MFQDAVVRSFLLPFLVASRQFGHERIFGIGDLFSMNFQ